jgi:hypothetical protein
LIVEVDEVAECAHAGLAEKPERRLEECVRIFDIVLVSGGEQPFDIRIGQVVAGSDADVPGELEKADDRATSSLSGKSFLKVKEILVG